jgi:hypothetical protein
MKLAPFPSHWNRILMDGFPLYARLPAEDRQELKGQDDTSTGRAIHRPWPPGSAANGPRPSGPDWESWVRVRHRRPQWLGHRQGPRVLRQCQARACHTQCRRPDLRNQAGH